MGGPDCRVFGRIAELNPELVWWNGRARAGGIPALGYPVERVPKALTSQDTYVKALASVSSSILRALIARRKVPGKREP